MIVSVFHVVLHLSKHSSADLAENCGQQKNHFIMCLWMGTAAMYSVISPLLSQLSTWPPTFFLKCAFGVCGKIVQAITFLSTARSEDYLIFSHPLFHLYWLTQIVGKMSKIFYVIQTLNYLLGNGKCRTAWLNTHCSNMQTFATK